MAKPIVLEIFFDYACPYCLKGYEDLQELLPDTGLQIRWRPCEAHPRPDPYGPHSDLCIQGMFFAEEQGADLWEYHCRMYKAALRDRVDIQQVDVLCRVVDGLLDVEQFRAALQEQRYRSAQQKANYYAFEQSGVWVVPAYRLSTGRRLDSIENIGVSRQELAAFLDGAVTC